MPFPMQEGRYEIENYTVLIGYIAAEFYMLQALELMSAGKFESFRKSHDKWRDDFLSHKHVFEERFAKALFDYMVMACAGEARHASDKCSYYLDYLPTGGGRYSSAEVAFRYDPISVSKVTQYLFEHDWAGGYGGRAWAKIARAVRYYKEMPLTAFIDHCVDLSHNNGSVFNKYDLRVFRVCSNYAAFLDDKSEAETPEELVRAVCRHGFCSGLSSRLFNLVDRAEALGFFSPDLFERMYDACHHLRYEVDKLLTEYEPIVWGEEMLPDDFEESQEQDPWDGCCHGEDRDYCKYSCGEHCDACPCSECNPQCCQGEDRDHCKYVCGNHCYMCACSDCQNEKQEVEYDTRQVA